MNLLFSIDLACANPGKGKHCSHKVIAEETPKDWLKPAKLPDNIFKENFLTEIPNPSLQEPYLTLSYWKLLNGGSILDLVVAFRRRDVLTSAPAYTWFSNHAIRLEFQRGDTLRAKLLLLGGVLKFHIEDFFNQTFCAIVPAQALETAQN